MHQGNQGFIDLLIFIVFAVVLAGAYMEHSRPKEHKNVSRHSEHTPVVFRSSSAKGRAEFVHIGGKSEVLEVDSAELMCLGEVDDPEATWQLNAWPDQKGFFSVTLNGQTCTRFNAGQLTHYDEYRSKGLDSDLSPEERPEDSWRDFHSADIAFRNRKPVSILYRHVRPADGGWEEVATWEAKF